MCSLRFTRTTVQRQLGVPCQSLCTGGLMGVSDSAFRRQ